MRQHLITYVDKHGQRRIYTTAYSVAQIGSAVLDCESKYGYSDVKAVVSPLNTKPKIR